MTSVRATQRSSLGFRLFTIPLLLIIIPALDRPIAQATLPFGSVSSDEKSLSVPSVGTLLTRGMQATPTQAHSWSMPGIGSVLRQYAPVGQHQIDDPSNLWYSLLPSRDQPTLPLTIQRKNAQPMISLQNPALLKAVL